MKHDKQIHNNLFISELTITNSISLLDEEQQHHQIDLNNQDKSKVVIGSYLLGKQIGSGSFGKVHLGLHLPTKQKVGIKIMNKQKFRIQDIPRIKSQIQILSKIRHRHIINLYQIIQTKKSILMVTQYMPNGQLFNHILNSKKQTAKYLRLTEQEACIYFQQIISAVQYLHNRGIAHRDLKPQNILIDYDKQLKLIDFGLSSQYEQNQQLKSFCGSPCYAAPQLLLAKASYSPLQADVWSCGVILYTMLCGYLPFCDPNSYSLYKKILQCQYKFPNFISASSRNLIQNILILNPKKRFTIKQIKQHEWFTTIIPKPTFGLFKDQYLPLNKQIVKQLTKLNLQEQKLIQSLSKNQKDKYSAAYYILMKKKISKGQKIYQYIGNDYFNHKMIIKKEQKIQQNVETVDVIKPEIFVDQQIVVSKGMVNPLLLSSKNQPVQLKDVETQQQPMIKTKKQLQVIANKPFILAMATHQQQIKDLPLSKDKQQNDIIGPYIGEQQNDKIYQKRLMFYHNNYHLLKKRLNLQESIFSISQKLQYQRAHKTRKTNRYINSEVETTNYKGKQLLWINFIYKKQFRNTMKRERSMSTIKNGTVQVRNFLPPIKNRSFLSKKSNKRNEKYGQNLKNGKSKK